MIPKMASLSDYEEFAKRTMAKTHFDYINSFAEDGVAKHDNLNDF